MVSLLLVLKLLRLRKLKSCESIVDFLNEALKKHSRSFESAFNIILQSRQLFPFYEEF